MEHKSLTITELIAPCGMNCSICMAYLREKNRCPGCRGPDVGKPITRLRCKIKKCSKLDSRFCFDCKDFPCDKLHQLDKRYRTKYGMSMITNLESIKKLGVKRFAEEEKIMWSCPKCGGTICVHNRKCLNCLEK